MRKIRAKLKKGIAVSTFLFALFFPWVSSAASFIFNNQDGFTGTYDQAYFNTPTDATTTQSISCEDVDGEITAVELPALSVPVSGQATMRAYIQGQYSTNTVTVVNGSPVSTTTFFFSPAVETVCGTGFDVEFFSTFSGASNIIFTSFQSNFYRGTSFFCSGSSNNCVNDGYDLGMRIFYDVEDIETSTQTIFLTSQVSTSTCTTEGTTSICTFEYGTLKEIGLIEYVAVILTSMSIVLFIFWIIRMFV